MEKFLCVAEKIVYFLLLGKIFVYTPQIQLTYIIIALKFLYLFLVRETYINMSVELGMLIPAFNYQHLGNSLPGLHRNCFPVFLMLLPDSRNMVPITKPSLVLFFDPKYVICYSYLQTKILTKHTLSYYPSKAFVVCSVLRGGL